MVSKTVYHSSVSYLSYLHNPAMFSLTSKTIIFIMVFDVNENVVGL